MNIKNEIIKDFPSSTGVTVAEMEENKIYIVPSIDNKKDIGGIFLTKQEGVFYAEPFLVTKKGKIGYYMYGTGRVNHALKLKTAEAEEYIKGISLKSLSIVIIGDYKDSHTDKDMYQKQMEDMKSLKFPTSYFENSFKRVSDLEIGERLNTAITFSRGAICYEFTRVENGVTARLNPLSKTAMLRGNGLMTFEEIKSNAKYLYDMEYYLETFTQTQYEPENTRFMDLMIIYQGKLSLSKAGKKKK